MPPTKCLCKVTADGKEYYLLSCETQRNEEVESFDLTLSDGSQAWSGQVTNDDLEVFCNKVKMDYDEMVKETRKALTKDGTGNINFLYQVKISSSSLKFLWKKHVATENIKFQLGSADLQQEPDTTAVIREIFDYAISAVGDFQQDIRNLQSDNERLVSERASALKRLEKYVRAKEDIEAELYSKFVVVLNDKKAKLRNLRDDNEALQNGSAATTMNENAAGPSQPNARRVIQSEDDNTDSSDDDARNPKANVKLEYDSEYGTDEEEKETKPPPSKKSRKVKEEPLDTSGELMLGASPEQEDGATITSRRRRQRAGSGKKQTPSKPVIPKVPSSEQKNKPGPSKQRSGRASMRKSTSALSKSSDNIDADVLMDDI